MVIYSDSKKLFSPPNLPRVMFTFVKTHLYPIWKLHSGTNKDEIDNPLRYCQLTHDENNMLSTPAKLH